MIVHRKTIKWPDGRVTTTDRPIVVPPPKVPFPTKVRRLVMALKRWNAMGRQMASREQRRERLAACAKCEFWDPRGNFGLGQCGAPGCGCSRYKAILASEDCPHPSGSRWPKILATTTQP